jgi:hypothetical protein
MPAQTQSLPYEDNQNFTIFTRPKIRNTETSLRHNLRKSQVETSPFSTTTDSSIEDVNETFVLTREEEELPSAEMSRQHASRRAEVYGTVVEIEKVSVLCEIYMDEKQERTVVVRLPKSLFPSHIRYGSPITLAYRKDASGFKRPRVTIRRFVLDDRMKKENDEMENLINSL